MTKEEAKLFVNAPNVLDGNHVSKLDTASAEYQSANSGNVDGVFETETEVLGQIRQLVSVLPANNETDLSYSDCEDDLNRVVNVEGYVSDAKSLLITISDNQAFIETKKDYAKDMVTGFVRFNGTTVGCVANQGTEGGDVLSVKGAYKAAEFVSFCDAFEIPVLTLTNVKGFEATVAAEKGIAIASAKLTYAFANADVPKVNIITGEAYGSAYVSMNSKSLGADLVYAWPTASIGMMDSQLAAKIMYADEIAAASDVAATVSEKAAEYAKLQSSVESAAARGYVDAVIDPENTRQYVAAAFEMLFSKREVRPDKKHGTV